MAVDLPAFGPNTVVRVGRASTLRIGETLLISFGEIRTLLRATFCEFTSVLRETAVKPFRACMFA
jgi:hypothetical protein